MKSEIRIKAKEIYAKYVLDHDLDEFKYNIRQLYIASGLKEHTQIASAMRASFYTDKKTGTDENGLEVELESIEDINLTTLLKKLKEIETVDIIKFPEIEDINKVEQLTCPKILIEGLLHQGSKMSIGGASKSYKTWFLIDLGLSVAYGQQWLGMNTTQANVLYVNLEIPKYFFKVERYEKIMATKDVIRQDGVFDCLHLRGFNACYSEIFPRIKKALKNKTYGLIILDPIYKLYGEADENSAKDIAKLLNAVENLANESNAAVVFGAHYSKGNQASKSAQDRISGSGTFARDPDSLINLTAHGKENCFTFDSTLRNFAPKEQFVIEWNYPLFSVVDEDPDDLREIDNKGRPEIFTDQEIIDSLGTEKLTIELWFQKTQQLESRINPSKVSLYKRIRKLLDSGLIVKDGYRYFAAKMDAKIDKLGNVS